MEAHNINGMQYSVQESPYDIYTETGRHELIERHTSGTFNDEDIESLREKGYLVIAVAFGQNLYQRVDDDAL